MSDNCIFCKIIAGEIPCDKVYEDDNVIAFHDINPQAPTHILVVPKKHRESLAKYEAGDAEEIGQVMVAASAIAREQGLDEYRTVINCGPSAGQTVWHLHLHLMGDRDFTWPPG